MTAGLNIYSAVVTVRLHLFGCVLLAVLAAEFGLPLP